MHTASTMHSLKGLHIQGLYEYLLVVQPGTDVSDKVNQEKQCFYNLYGGTSTKKQSNITVVNFIAREEMEETIVRYLHRICSYKQSFSVLLNNYSGFPPHTVYLRIQDPTPFQQLAKELKAVDNYICTNGCPPAHFTKTPHLTIAGELSENVYQKALINYSQKTFNDTFSVNELLLLKKSNQFDTGKTVSVFRLQPAFNNQFN